MSKPTVFLTSSVFREISLNPKVSGVVKEGIARAWDALEAVAIVDEFNGRFPDPDVIKRKVLDPAVRFVGCHLSHAIEEDWLRESNVVAVSTSTMGFDHVGKAPGVIITHTPRVLQNTVADYTVALILSNLRNIVGLHETVWGGSWKAGQKWDLDENLSTALDRQVVGLIGLGEIGSEVARRLKPWNVKILYFDVNRREGLESTLGLEFVGDMKRVFAEADLVSLHLPLNDGTKGIIDASCLSAMKDNALLVNTARGGVINTPDLLSLLESGKQINLAFDVHETEPLEAGTLMRFKTVAEENPGLRFVMAPHNASSDANTRGKMAIMLLEDLAWLAGSKKINDIRNCRIIKKQKEDIFDGGNVGRYRINNYWKE
ncbi:MAG: 2-hydroxyacid dehydrogenase [Promethearchaeota archaeon]